MIKMEIDKSYKIIWHDAFHRLGWMMLETITEDAPITTYGILVKETKTHYIIAASKTHNYGHLNGIMGIPKQVINSVVEVA